MWITKYIDLPDEIIEAQKNGELVIFAGAGISTPSPSNLPNFEKLAVAIARGFFPYDNTIPIDTFLGKLLNRKIKVHEKAIELLTSQASKPCSYHRNLFKLFEKNQIKIVTTNFDDHFKSASNIEIPYYTAPALPLGRDFTGVVHLHGSVTKRPQDLVLTDSDFGRAYFTDAWATNFLRGMFSNYVVLFIGFSANDPVIKYIARGLGSNNRNRYAFTEEGLHDHWNHLQIKYIEYPRTRHDLLEEAIDAWVIRTEMGVFEQRKLIKDIVEKPPEFNVVEESYISNQLKDDLGAQHFFDLANDFQWVEWMYNNKSLDPLFNTENGLTPFKHMQARWFSSFLGNEPEKMMKIIMEKDRVSTNLKQYLIRELYRKDVELSPNAIGKWFPVLLGHVNYHKEEENIEYIAHNMEYPENKEQILILFDYFTRPITKYKRKFSLSENNNDELVDIEIEVQGDAYWLGEIWRKSIYPNLDYFAIPLMYILINQLQMVTLLLKATGHGKWDPVSFSRSAIETHEQDRYSDSMDLVIDCCRDVLEYLIEVDGMLALSFINQFIISESKLLKRISIHGYKLIAEVPIDKKIVWLVNNNLLFMSDYKHEVYQLIKYIYSASSVKSKRTFLKYVTEEFDKKRTDEDSNKEVVDYEEYNLCYWLTLSDDKCHLARRAFLNAKKKNKRFKAREYPDFTHWSSIGGFSPTTSNITVNNILLKDPYDAKDLKWLITYKEEDHPFDKREGFLEVVTSAIATQNDWGWNLLRRLASPPRMWKTDLWKAILKGFKEINLNNDEWVEISKILVSHGNLNEFRYEVAYLFDKATNSHETNFELSISIIIKIFHKIFNSVQDSDISSVDDALTQAINHPVGKFTEFFCYVYIQVFNEEKANKKILDEIKINIFSRLINRSDEKSQMGKIILANRLHIFLTIDEDWSKKNLIPLFDPTFDIEMAKMAWNAYAAYGGKWNERILESLFPKLLLIMPIAKELNTQTQEGIYRLSASLLFYSTDFSEPLRSYFLTTGNEDQFILLTNELSQCLKQLEVPVIKQAWGEWLNNYLRFRLDNLPVVMSDEELSEIIEWLPSLEAVLEDFVTLIITAKTAKLRNARIIYQIGRNELGRKYPQALLIYLEFILRDNGMEFYSDEAFNVMSQILETLPNKHEYFPVVCEHLIRSNVPKAVELKDRYDKKFK